MRRAENPSPRQASARRGVLHSMYGPDRAARASFEERRRNAPRKCTGVFALAETTSKTRHSHGSFLDLATDMGTTTWTTAGRTASRRNEARKCTGRLHPAKTTSKPATRADRSSIRLPKRRRRQGQVTRQDRLPPKRPEKMHRRLRYRQNDTKIPPPGRPEPRCGCRSGDVGKDVRRDYAASRRSDPRKCTGPLRVRNSGRKKRAPKSAVFGGGPCGRPARTAMRRSKASLIRRRSPSRPPSPWRGRPRERRSCDRDRRCGQSPH